MFFLINDPNDLDQTINSELAIIDLYFFNKLVKNEVVLNKLRISIVIPSLDNAKIRAITTLKWLVD